MEITIYGKADCAKCDVAKERIGKELGLDFKYWDMETPDGITEYCMSGFDVKFSMRYPVITIDNEAYDIVGKATQVIKEKMGDGA